MHIKIHFMLKTIATLVSKCQLPHFLQFRSPIRLPHISVMTQELFTTIDVYVREDHRYFRQVTDSLFLEIKFAWIVGETINYRMNDTISAVVLTNVV